MAPSPDLSPDFSPDIRWGISVVHCRGEDEVRRSPEAEPASAADDRGMGAVDRIEAGDTWVSDDGPTTVDPLEGHTGMFVDVCAALTEAELEELCRHWEERADVAACEIDRWWCWTVVRFGRRLLAARREERERLLRWF
ncbi:hypothetical protein ASG70_08115 [Phycicoccus sp. Soil748]|nr:hypothetical protein ASG70_08115 [Phycicoccus sp. Soil748]